MPRLRKLLWIDCTAAALAGVVVLALSGWLGRLYALPEELLLSIAGVNLLYGSFSFSLAVRADPPLSLIRVLVGANAGWAVVCLGLAGVFRDEASVFGFAHLVGEAIFVGGLAGLEALAAPAAQPVVGPSSAP